MDARHIIEAATELGRTNMDEENSKKLLESFGVSVPKACILTEPSQAGKVFSSVRPPVVAKIISKDVIHKSDIGGVRVGINTAIELEMALAEIEKSVFRHTTNVEGFLVEEMIPEGHEVVVGGLTDRTFGPLIMFGLGGIYVEILADVSFRICPITRMEARDMIEELKTVELLRGARGGLRASEDLIVDTLMRVGGKDGLMMTLEDKISEIDINPLIISHKEAVAVDARVILK